MRSSLGYAKGIVRNIFDDEMVEVLLEYNEDGERQICEIPSEYWQNLTPVPDQYIEIIWDSQNPEIPPTIRETAPFFENHTSSIAASWAKDVCGLELSSKVLFVVGPNPPRDYNIRELLDKSDKYELVKDEYQNLLSHLYLKAAGWGECLCLTRLIYLLDYLGVPKTHVEFKLCETTYKNFDPKDYSEYTIIFLGSIKSNEVLRELYWSKLALKIKYEFKGTDLIIHKEENDTDPIILRSKDNIHTVPREKPELMEVRDYFLLAKVPNPYSKPGSGFHCILLSGVGTIGTGYAGVTLSGKQSIRTLHRQFGKNNFDIVGKVDMKKMFNPESDPVSCVYDGQKQLDPEQELLPNALRSPTVWSSECLYAQEDFKKDMQRFRKEVDGRG